MSVINRPRFRNLAALCQAKKLLDRGFSARDAVAFYDCTIAELAAYVGTEKKVTWNRTPEPKDYNPDTLREEIRSALKCGASVNCLHANYGDLIARAEIVAIFRELFPDAT